MARALMTGLASVFFAVVALPAGAADDRDAAAEKAQIVRVVDRYNDAVHAESARIFCEDVLPPSVRGRPQHCRKKVRRTIASARPVAIDAKTIQLVDSDRFKRGAAIADCEHVRAPQSEPAMRCEFVREQKRWWFYALALNRG